MGVATAAAIVLYIGLSIVKCQHIPQVVEQNAGTISENLNTDVKLQALRPLVRTTRQDLLHDIQTQPDTLFSLQSGINVGNNDGQPLKHSVASVANFPLLTAAATSHNSFPPIRTLHFNADDGRSGFGSHYSAFYPTASNKAIDSHEHIAREYSNDQDFNNEADFLDTKGYTQYKSSQSFNIAGPHQLETISSKSYHKEVEPYDIGDFEHKHKEDEEHAEVHYHQHKHLHKHAHKQEHVHKHKDDHKHKHGHKHEHQGHHDHKHESKHQHNHHSQHAHQHKGEHKHSHHNDHKHSHVGEHHHDHKHHGDHKHSHHHGHSHSHHSDHKHDHHQEHKHDHHHKHSHHGDHKHDHKHHGDHKHHHGHKHEHKHGHKHDHHHKHGHKHSKH